MDTIDNHNPFFTEDSIAIACTSSNDYVPYLSVYLQSIIDNASPSNNYDIFVFERDIAENNKHRLKKLVCKNNMSLRFINPVHVISDHNLQVHPPYTLECYFKLCAPLLLDKLKKIIFTDVDLVFQKDPALLYRLDIEGYPLAACKDLVYGAMLNRFPQDLGKYAREVLRLEHPYEYFNTGVLLFNVEVFNKNNYSRKLIEIVSQNLFRILEQDALNYFFQTGIKYIDTAWNFAVPIRRYTETLKRLSPASKEQFQADAGHPNIIHWAGRGKPWWDLQESMAEHWWHYARRSPFYEEIYFNMLKTDFKKLSGLHSQDDVIATLQKRVDEIPAVLHAQGDVIATFKKRVDETSRLIHAQDDVIATLQKQMDEFHETAFLEEYRRKLKRVRLKILFSWGVRRRRYIRRKHELKSVIRRIENSSKNNK